PRRADARAAEKGGDGLGDVREIRGHPVACDDAGFPKRTGDGPGARPQLSPGPLAQRPQLGRMADRDVAVCTAAEDVLCIAEARTRKPPGSRHLARGEHALVRLARVDLEQLPDRRPELLELVDRPLPQGCVVLESEPARLVDPLSVARD